MLLLSVASSSPSHEYFNSPITGGHNRDMLLQASLPSVLAFARIISTLPFRRTVGRLEMGGTSVRTIVSIALVAVGKTHLTKTGWRKRCWWVCFSFPQEARTFKRYWSPALRRSVNPSLAHHPGRDGAPKNRRTCFPRFLVVGKKVILGESPTSPHSQLTSQQAKTSKCTKCKRRQSTDFQATP
jgi:hypothetical protein